MKTTDTLSSLMFLADEPDERLYIDIANAIINYGEVALPYLKKKYLTKQKIFADAAEQETHTAEEVEKNA